MGDFDFDFGPPSTVLSYILVPIWFCHVIVVGVTSNFLFDNSIVGEGDLNLERLRWKQQDALVELQGFW